MKKGFLIYFPAFVLTIMAFAFASCNSDETWESEPQIYSGTKVTGFSLKANAKVLNNLDSVYFSIDLLEGKIYNASPLPTGTRIDSIAVSISGDACSVAELRINAAADKEAAVINYLTSPDEGVDFSRGPVILHLVSADGQHERDYEIKLNVAAEKSDSLYWDKLQGGAIPGITSGSRAKTVKSGATAIMLSQSASGNVSISTFVPAPQTGGGEWMTESVVPCFTVGVTVVNAAPLLNIATFTATESGSLYVSDYTGNLYHSSDNGANFTKVDSDWETITAPYRDAILGVKNNGGHLTWAAYPPQAWVQSGQAISPDFPIEGVSGSATFSTKWASAQQIVVTGGKTSDGTFTGATWAFDGKRWAKISDRLPAAAGYALSKYTVAETDTVSWRVSQREVLITFGGLGEEPVNEVWISRDMGVNWQKGSDLLQMPEYIPFTTGASLLVFDKLLGTAGATPLAVKPITTWECPYLYLFGGYDANDALHTTYWSGVVNHLKLKPLQ